MMAEKAISQVLYKMKNELVSHSGSFGKKLEEAVAQKWVHDTKRSVELAKTSSEIGIESDLGAFTEYQKRAVSRKYPSVGIVIYSLAIGGGEIFPIHLANCLWEMGVPTILIDCALGQENCGMRSLVNQQLPVLTLKGLEQLPGAIRHYKIEIIHSHHAKIDLAISYGISMKMIYAHQVITLHGMYEALDKPRAEMIVRRVSETADYFAYIADKNLLPFRDARITIDKRFNKLPNGLPGGSEEVASRTTLGIEKDAFVLCLVSRALPEKGWEEAAEAVILANRATKRPIHLLLVGAGEMYEKMKRLRNPYIHLVGAQHDTRKFLLASDMGFLPSRYSGESFPLSLIDSFMCGKPVIATKMGEIPEMIHTKSGNAGYLVSLTPDGKVPVDKIASAIVNISSDKEIYRKMCSCAQEAAQRYDINRVADCYVRIYQSAVKRPLYQEQLPDVKILISCHKPSMVLHSSVFIPIQVGTVLSSVRFPGMLHDDEGENISGLNKEFCEMTAQYWAWKNLKADYYGFFHYRRYLSFSDQRFLEDSYGNVYEPSLTEDTRQQSRIIHRYGWADDHIREVMREYDVVTIQPRSVQSRGRNENVIQQFASASYLHVKDLRCVMEIIQERYPEYVKAAKQYLLGSEAYYCNMYICRSDIFDQYCNWVFPILEEFCKRTDMSNYNTAEQRTPGHLAERLWGVYYCWLKETGMYRMKETQCIVFSHTEKRNYNLGEFLTDTFRLIVHRVLN